jgi:hypothetical protein
VTVNAKKVIGMTLDDLVEEFWTRLGTLTKAAEAFATSHASDHAGQQGTPKGRSLPKPERKGSP